MIKYNLICNCGKTFESWFSSSNEFDSLCKKKLIKCIYCDSSLVKKTVMAPSLGRKSNKILKKTGLQVVMQEYRLFFPAFFKILRPSEQYLKWFPLGGQYFVIAKKY